MFNIAKLTKNKKSFYTLLYSQMVHTVKNRCLIFVLCSVIWINFQASAQLSQYSYDQTFRNNPTQTVVNRFFLWIPDNTTLLKGVVMISGRGVGHDPSATTDFYRRKELRAMCAAKQLALITFEGTSGDNGIVINFNPGLGHEDSLMKALVVLSAMSAHPEIKHLPIITFGHSAALNFCQNIAYAMPGRTAGIIIYRIGDVNKPVWANDADVIAGIPNLIVSGEVEGPDIQLPFFAPQARSGALQKRASGHLVQHIVERNTSHSALTDKQVAYLVSFISKVADYRIPANSNATEGLVTLNAIPATDGWLCRSLSFNNFKSANYAIAAFTSGVLDAATSFWAFDEQQANEWLNFHIAPFEFVSLAPMPSTNTVLCQGDTLLISYRKTSSNFVPTGANVYFVELSNARGDFNSYSFPPRIIGMRQTNADSGVIRCLIPDNMQHEISPFQQRRYRIRIRSTETIEESNNSGELVGIEPCVGNACSLWMTSLGNAIYQKGDSVLLRIFKPEATMLNDGNTINIELSDTAGVFGSAGVLLGSITTTMPGTGLRNITVKVGVPSSIPTAYSYRIRAVTSNPPLEICAFGLVGIFDSSNIVTPIAAHDVSTQSRFIVFPNPAQHQIRIKLSPGCSKADIYVFNVKGSMIMHKQLNEDISHINTFAWRKGLYYVKLVDRHNGLGHTQSIVIQ